MGLALALLVAPGCAKGGALDEGQQDAAPVGEDAAPRPDAEKGPTPVTLSQTTSDEIVAGNSFSCALNDGSGIHDENSYYRVFDLAAEGINTDLEVDKVSLAIEFADAGGDASQPIEVKLHTLEGSFVVANLTELASTQVSVPDQTLSMLDVDIAATVPGGSKLVVEVFTPDGTGSNHAFRPGSNDSGESAPGFIRAPVCGNDEPIDISTVIVNNEPSTMDLILEVSGVY